MTETFRGQIPKESSELSPEDQEILNAQRAQNDVELLRGGAEIVKPNSQARLEPTAEQEVEAKMEMYDSFRESSFYRGLVKVYRGSNVEVFEKREFSEDEIRRLISEAIGVEPEDVATTSITFGTENYRPLDINFMLRPEKARELYPAAGSIIFTYALKSKYFSRRFERDLRYEITAVYETVVPRETLELVDRKRALDSFKSKEERKANKVLESDYDLAWEERILKVFKDGEWQSVDPYISASDYIEENKELTEEEKEQSRKEVDEGLLKMGGEMSIDNKMNLPIELQYGLWADLLLEKHRADYFKQIDKAKKIGPHSIVAADYKIRGQTFRTEEIMETICRFELESNGIDITPADLILISCTTDIDGNPLIAEFRMNPETIPADYTDQVIYYFELNAQFEHSEKEKQLKFSRDIHRTTISRIIQDEDILTQRAHLEAKVALGDLETAEEAADKLENDINLALKAEIVAEYDPEEGEWFDNPDGQ